MADTVKTRFRVTGAESYAEKTKRATKSLKDFGDESKKADSSLDQLKDGYDGISTKVAAFGAAAIAATATIRELGEALYEMGMRGGDVSAVSAAFEQLSSQETLGRMREAVGGLVSDFDLMREATQALRSGLVNEDEITRWYRAVTRGAQDAGESIESTHAALGNMLAGGGFEEVLTKLGVNMNYVRGRVRESGESMESTQGQALALDIALEELERTTQGIGNSIGNLNDAWTQLAATTQNWYDQLSEGFSENDRLISMFRTLNVQVDDGRVAWDQYGAAIGDVFVDALDGVLAFAQGFFRMHRQVHEAIVGDSALANLFGIRQVGQGSLRYEEMFASARRELTSGMAPPSAPEDLEGLQRERGSGGVGRAPRSRFDYRAPRRGGGGSGGSFEYFDFFQEEIDKIAGLERAYAELAEIEQAADQERHERYVAQAAKQREEEEHIVRMSILEGELHQKRRDNLMEMTESSRRAMEERREQQEEEAQRLEKTFSTLGQGVTMIGDIFGQVADAQDESTKKADAWRKVVGVAKGTFYAVEAVAAAADAYKAGAQQNYAGMAMGIISAAKYGVASGYMFSKVAQTGGDSGVTERSAGTFTPTQPDRVNTQITDPQEPERITVLGLGNTDAGVAAAVWRANKELVRSGRSGLRTSKGVGYMG